MLTNEELTAGIREMVQTARPEERSLVRDILVNTVLTREERATVAKMRRPSLTAKIFTPRPQQTVPPVEKKNSRLPWRRADPRARRIF